jgi:hypothetical protein
MSAENISINNEEIGPDLPIISTREGVLKRLGKIFPPGTPQRTYCVRELSASTIYVMLYIGAIEGQEVYLSPKHVYRMTAEQSSLLEPAKRIQYRETFTAPGARWYADNTREPIRDETLREGLIYVGAVIVRKDIPTTSSKPRYALKREFANLFDPNLTEEQFEILVENWQKNNLSRSALARVQLLNSTELSNKDYILVDYPNRETRRLSIGPSSIISKAVIESFSKIFLENSVVLWLSESGNKVVTRDDELARRIGIEINVSEDLPDIILVDLTSSNDVLIIFIEVVATDGAITDRRREALYKLTDKAKIDRANVLFVTAYLDKGSPAFKKTFQSVAWNTLIWFASEPGSIFLLKAGSVKLSALKHILLSNSL